MNLEDVLVDGNIFQDTWSATRPRFGADNQLEVTGWSGKRKGDKYYIVKCHECAKDRELFGEAYFRTFKFSLTKEKPQMPCGCAKNTHWTKEQYELMAHRTAESLGLSFLGICGDFKGAETSIRINCKDHGTWVSKKVSHFINLKKGCKNCGDLNASIKRTKPEEFFVDSFMSTGKFIEGTTFKFIGRIKNKTARLWEVYCARCGVTFRSRTGSLQEGKVGCSCSFENQKEAYINGILLDNQLIGLKFGVSGNAVSRACRQDRLSGYAMQQLVVYEFDSAGNCRQAEKFCKTYLESGIFSKAEVPDGYTETSSVANFDAICVIFQRFGGRVKQENNGILLTGSI